MALYDQIKQNLSRGPGGQLSSTSNEELQNQSAAMERPTVPTVPSEAATITGNPDVAKMAGTPNNLANAIRQGVRKEMDRSTVERTQQPSTKLSEADKAKQQQQQMLEQNIQDLPARVQNLARQQFQAAAAQGSMPSVDSTKFDAQRPATASDADWATAKELAAKIANGTATTTDIAKLQNITGKPVDATSIATWMGGESEAVQAAIANALPDTAMLSEVYPEQDKITAIASALGLTPEQVSGMSFKQFQDAVKDKQDKDFNETNKLRQQAVDPSLSPAERDAARRQLKDMGATGLSSIERDAASVESRIQNGDQVTFNGQQMGIEEALSDDNVKGTIKRYFEEPEFAAQLKQSEPDFATLIDNNKAYFEQKAKEVEPTLAEFSRIQEANASISNLGDGLPKVSDDVMKQLIPDWGKASGTQYETPALITAMKQFGPGEKASLLANVEKVAKYPELMNELKDFDANALAKEGFLDGNKIDTLLNTYSDYKSIENLAPQAAGESDVRNVLGGVDLSQYEDKLDDYWTMVNLGQDKDGSISKFLNVIDANRDGTIDSAADIVSKAKNLIDGGGQVTLSSLISRGVPSPDDVAKNGLASASQGLATDSVRNLVDKYKGMMDTSGHLDYSLVNKNLSLGDALELEGLVGSNGNLSNVINSKADEQVSKLVPGVVALSISSGNMASGDSAAVDEMYKQYQQISADPSIPQIVKDKFKEQYYKASKLQQTYVKTQNNAKALLSQTASSPALMEQIAKSMGYSGPTTSVQLVSSNSGSKFGSTTKTVTVPNPEYTKFVNQIKDKLQQAATGSQNKDMVSYIETLAKFRK